MLQAYDDMMADDLDVGLPAPRTHEEIVRTLHFNTGADIEEIRSILAHYRSEP